MLTNDYPAYFRSDAIGAQHHRIYIDPGKGTLATSL
ncbi:MAG: hypothetical protein RJA20_2304 [Bacteroidota bacterium]|jgi:hypothetical protein